MAKRDFFEKKSGFLSAAGVFAPFGAADAVDVPFEVAAFQQFGENQLFEGGDGAGIEAGFLFEQRQQRFGQNHVADTESRRNGFREGVEVEDAGVGTEGKEGFFPFGGEGKLRFEIVFDDEPVAAGNPIQIFVPFGSRGGHAGGKAAVRGKMEHLGGGGGQRPAVDAVVTERQQVAADAGVAVNLADFFVGRRFDGEQPPFTEHQGNQTVEVFGTRPDNQAAAVGKDAAVAGQIAAEGVAKRRHAGVGRLFEDGFAVAG